MHQQSALPQRKRPSAMSLVTWWRISSNAAAHTACQPGHMLQQPHVPSLATSKLCVQPLSPLLHWCVIVHFHAAQGCSSMHSLTMLHGAISKTRAHRG